MLRPGADGLHSASMKKPATGTTGNTGPLSAASDGTDGSGTTASFPTAEAAVGVPTAPRSGLTVTSRRTARGGRLGAQVLPGGVKFSVFSAHARRIHVALFSPGESDPIDVLPLPDVRGNVFEGFVPGIGPGWQYGFHAEGPFDPRHGHRFNPRKFLLDPHARAIAGAFRNEAGVLCGHAGAGHDADLARDHRPSRDFMPRGLIVDETFDWQGVEAPRVAREDLVIYEVHVRGFTRDDSAEAAHPGTFLGLIAKIPWLKSLGINAVELLPVHAKYSEDLLLERGLSNYWGYNSASFFALEPSYGSGRSPGCELVEFKTMVRELHRAGIVVLLDVVYNHTAEGNELGPTLSLRGLDNASYYSLTGPEDAPERHYRNYTGCGNTLNFGSAAALGLTMDSLRYFASSLRVDGFRFDLATVHGRRGGTGFDPDAPFFTAVAQDPVLRDRILIAEPWDVEAHGTGRFPGGWMEWNDAFRDTVRRWVRGDAGTLAALHARLEGSPDLYAGARREPWTSVNFVTAHDGFTLRDLVTYNHKHNLANGEDNRDGSSGNHSWNCGHEGPGGGDAVEALRARQARNLMLLTVLARGTPMILGGDEFLRTQGGNNNAYCQDNPVSWFDWSRARAENGFVRFTSNALAWRARIAPPGGWGDPAERMWGRCWQGFTPAGKPWANDHSPSEHQAALLLHPRPVTGPWPENLDPAQAPPCCLLLNNAAAAALFHLPPLPPRWEWRLVADTALAPPDDITDVGTGRKLPVADRCEVAGRSTVLLRAFRADEVAVNRDDTLNPPSAPETAPVP